MVGNMGEDDILDIKPKVKKLANQFNFCERAALTYVYPRRVTMFALKCIIWG